MAEIDDVEDSLVDVFDDSDFFVDDVPFVKHVEGGIDQVDVSEEDEDGEEPKKLDQRMFVDSNVGSAVVDNDYTEEDLMVMTEIIINLPCMIWTKLPERPEDKIVKANKAFYKYCKRKGIDPFDFFFEELELVLVVMGLAGSYYQDYKIQYKGAPSPDKLNADFDHKQELDMVKEEKQEEQIEIKMEG